MAKEQFSTNDLVRVIEPIHKKILFKLQELVFDSPKFIIPSTTVNCSLLLNCSCVLTYNRTTTHILWLLQSKHCMLNNKKCWMMMKKEGVWRCCYELDPATMSPDIFLLTKQLDQVQNNIFVFKSAKKCLYDE